MSYLGEFQRQIERHDFHKFFQLWEEYATNDEVDPQELIQILDLIKESDFAELFGQFADTTIALWSATKDEELSYEIIKRVIDLQTTHSPTLATITMDTLKNRFGDDPRFKERIRILGLHRPTQFQGALSQYELLVHMEKGNFVFHTSGWGTGEIVNCSSLREQVSIEFENVAGIKHLNFENAFRTLIPLDKEHFLARRFADPDGFEQEAKQHPTEAVRLLLRDLGPLTSGEIKEELCHLVIPEKEWQRWWQSTRTKLKRDTRISCPTSSKLPFFLRKEEVTHAELLKTLLAKSTSPTFILGKLYTFTRDLPQALREESVVSTIQQHLTALDREGHLTEAERLQIYIFLEQLLDQKLEGVSLKEYLKNLDSFEEVVEEIPIIAFRKRALMLAKKCKENWVDTFFTLLFITSNTQIRDYILSELARKETLEKLQEKVRYLLNHAPTYPDLFLWYFQKIAHPKGSKLPYHDKAGQCKFLESFLILLHTIEHHPARKEIVKKIHNLIINKRFALIRRLIDDTSVEFIKEFLLLVSKCHSLSDHDKKILTSLALVVHPSLTGKEKKMSSLIDTQFIWTTEKGYRATQDRLQTIAEVEMVENAREVEAARALGDLRENAEYKFACERRARLQGEMKQLGSQLNSARILTPDDANSQQVSVGTVVSLQADDKEVITYTILGPWDTNVDNHVISYQSQLAQAMIGCKGNEQFTFRETTYTIKKISTIFEENR